MTYAHLHSHISTHTERERVLLEMYAAWSIAPMSICLTRSIGRLPVPHHRERRVRVPSDRSMSERQERTFFVAHRDVGTVSEAEQLHRLSLIPPHRLQFARQMKLDHAY